MVQEIIKYGFIISFAIAALVYFVMDYKNKKLKQQLDNQQREVLKEKLNNIENKDILNSYEKAKQEYENIKRNNDDLLKRLRDGK